MNYKKIDSQDISYLKTAVPRTVCLQGKKSARITDTTNWGSILHAGGLIKVMDTGEVAAVMSYASEKTIPVVVRGAGTGWWEAPWPYMEESCWIQPP